VREAALTLLGEATAKPLASAALEAYLIRDGHYAGRRFTSETHQVLWNVGETCVRLFANGQNVCLAQRELSESDPPQKHAA